QPRVRDWGGTALSPRGTRRRPSHPAGSHDPRPAPHARTNKHTPSAARASPTSGRDRAPTRFFFQAEDGIRDRNVMEFRRVLFRSHDGATVASGLSPHHARPDRRQAPQRASPHAWILAASPNPREIAAMFAALGRRAVTGIAVLRSEERRVGKGGRPGEVRQRASKT